MTMCWVQRSPSIGAGYVGETTQHVISKGSQTTSTCIISVMVSWLSQHIQHFDLIGLMIFMLLM